MSEDVLQSPRELEILAAAPIGKAGVRPTSTLYVFGMVALAPDGSVVGEGDIEAQVQQALENMELVLAASGAQLKDVVATTLFLVNVEDAPKAVAVRDAHFTGAVPPRHTLVGVTALGNPQFLVEISAFAVLH